MKLEVKGISNKGYSTFQEIQKSNNATKEEKESDRIESSNAAGRIQHISENLIEIQKKIAKGFYNSDEVIERTSIAILKEFNLK